MRTLSIEGLAAKLGEGVGEIDFLPRQFGQLTSDQMTKCLCFRENLCKTFSLAKIY